MKKILIPILLFCSAVLFSENITEIRINSAGNGLYSVTASVNIPDGFHIIHNTLYTGIELTEPVKGLKLSNPEYSQGKEKYFDNQITGKTELVTEYYGTLEISAALMINSSVYENSQPLDFTVKYQLCDNAVCYPPQQEFHSVAFSYTPPQGSSGPGIFTVLLYLLLAFAGGVILNLTPCVLPVLSVKALHLLKQSDMNRKKILNNSLVYTSGILVSMLALALVTIILKLSGEYAGFSFQNQDPGFNNFLVILLFSFSLSMFGIYTIRLPGATKAAGASAKEGYSGSFFSGVFAILLGVSCTAPLLAPALGFAFSLPYFWIVVFFLTTGAGLAFPFLLLGIFPKIIQKFPKPGKWMNVFKEILAFGLLVFAVDRLNILLKLTGTIIPQLFYLLAAGLALWQYGKLGTPLHKLSTNIISLLLVIAVLVGGFLLIADKDYPEDPVSTAQTIPYPWQEFSPALLDKYLKEGRPVFIDFTADWCLNCRANKYLVLRTEEIENLFIRNDIELLLADFTGRDSEIAALIESWGKAGVPVYAFYPPGSGIPVFLPELLTKKAVYDLVRSYAGQISGYQERGSVPVPEPVSGPLKLPPRLP